MKKSLTKLSILPIAVLAFVFVTPLIYTFLNSFMSTGEITKYYLASREHIPFHIIPDSFSLSGYYGALIRRPDFLISFWNALLITVSIVTGQLVIASLSAYVFTFFRFRFRDTFFFLVIVLMMMPYQVTLVSNYIVLDRLGLIGSYPSVIIPGLFSAFGVFLLRLTIGAVPKEIVEAAKIDGASHLKILLKIIAPNCKAGMVSLVVLSFIDNWNMVEQPLVFLKDSSMYPLSIYLTEMSRSNFSLGFAAGMIALIPVMLLFFFFEDELVKGISATNLR